MSRRTQTKAMMTTPPTTTRIKPENNIGSRELAFSSLALACSLDDTIGFGVMMRILECLKPPTYFRSRWSSLRLRNHQVVSRDQATRLRPSGIHRILSSMPFQISYNRSCRATSSPSTASHDLTRKDTRIRECQSGTRLVHQSI